MKTPHIPALSAAAVLLTIVFGLQGLMHRSVVAKDLPAQETKAVKAIRALLLTGGCCHDYDNQKTILSAGIGERIQVNWKTIHEGGKGTTHRFAKLQEPGWESGYDVVVYNICFSHETDAEYIESIAKVHHAGLPAVALHCTAHTYHWKVDRKVWPEFLGMTSLRHGKHHPITVSNRNPGHPIMKAFPEEWVTPQGELYHIEKEWPSATVLAKGTIDGGRESHTCVWVNEYGKARVFATTLGHHNETMAHDTYLDLVARGLLWATDHLNESGEAEVGYGK